VVFEIGQPQVIDIVCRELRVKLNMFAVSTMWPRVTRLDDLFDTQERHHGIHGGECETSVMLHLHPELIEMERAKNFIPLSVELERSNGMLMPEGAVGFGWQTQDLNRDGACGNAAAADAERGGIVVKSPTSPPITATDSRAPIMYAIDDFVKELGDVAYTTDPMQIRIKSRDRYAVSPLLKQMLEGKKADVVVSPVSVDEIKTVVRAAVKFKIPIT
jgi:hypothetical protein